jgi:hypothetical protein
MENLPLEYPGNFTHRNIVFTLKNEKRLSVYLHTNLPPGCRLNVVKMAANKYALTILQFLF